MKNPDRPFLIGIDPDTHKSGLAIYNRHTKSLHLFEHELWKVFSILEQMKDEAIIRLEAGHKDKATWHKGGNAMAKKVGANHEIGRQIEKFCIEHGVSYELVKPCGFSSYSHEKFCQVTGWNKKERTNSEKRVAGLLVFGY